MAKGQNPGAVLFFGWAEEFKAGWPDSIAERLR